MRLRSLVLLSFFAVFGACKLERQPDASYASAPVLGEWGFQPGDTGLSENDLGFGLRQWLPEGKPKAVILALHGFNDYSRAFQGFGEYAAPKGIAVVAPDQRGFGPPSPQNEKTRGIWAGKKNLQTDAARLVAAAHAHWPGVPVILLGESMGAAVALTAVADGVIKPADLSGLILVSPAVWGGDTFNPMYRAPLWVLAHFSPSMALTGKGLKILPSDNFPMLIALSKDPGLIRQSRADAVLGLVELMDAGQEAGKTLPANLPTLIMYGAQDQIVPELPVAKLSENCHARAGVNCHAQRYPRGFHMLLRDLNAEGPMKDIAVWLANPNGPLPSGPEWKPDPAQAKAASSGESAPTLPGVSASPTKETPDNLPVIPAEAAKTPHPL